LTEGAIKRSDQVAALGCLRSAAGQATANHEREGLSHYALDGALSKRYRYPANGHNSRRAWGIIAISHINVLPGAFASGHAPRGASQVSAYVDLVDSGNRPFRQPRESRSRRSRETVALCSRWRDRLTRCRCCSCCQLYSFENRCAQIDSCSWAMGCLARADRIKIIESCLYAPCVCFDRICGHARCSLESALNASQPDRRSRP
jgi:hypothetical protein